ncbi:Fic family protein [Patescibacteria group bacterium]|nr:Fic family protein [Patescibacteria group bacterium]MCL5091381.1 Fic family protein [Patescibacteria group bacterium]
MFAPKFQITNKILSNIAQIEAAEEVIRHAPLLPLWEKQFKEDAIVRSAYHGTHIEGNRLHKDEAKDVLLGKTVIGRPRDIQEIINYRRVIEAIDEEAQRQIDKITEPLIKKLHRIIVAKILTQDQAGEYRHKQVIIRNSQTGAVTFRPPPAIEVPFLMREFIYWVNRVGKDEIHPVLKAGIAHHEMVRIHPFIDGNGRVSRSVATLILMLGGYDIRRFFSLEEYYDRDAVSYYENLQKASAGDLSAWLEYFTGGGAIEFEKIKEKVLKLSRDVKMKERFGGRQIYLTERQVKIVEYIQEVGYMQNQSFLTLFPAVSEDTVLRDIQDLVKKNLIRKIGSTKAARYVMV